MRADGWQCCQRCDKAALCTTLTICLGKRPKFVQSLELMTVGLTQARRKFCSLLYVNLERSVSELNSRVVLRVTPSEVCRLGVMIRRRSLAWHSQ